MRHFLIAALLSVSLAVAGCTGANSGFGNMGTKQTAGGLGGAVLGGLAGSQIGGGSGRLVAVGAGTLLGALVGSEVGKSLDRADMMYMERANSQAYGAPIGQTVQWNNPQSGNYGQVTPVNDYTAQSGRYCREFKQTIYVDNQPQTGFGTACQNADGTWQIS
jgi:surface antigen